MFDTMLKLVVLEKTIGLIAGSVVAVAAIVYLVVMWIKER